MYRDDDVPGPSWATGTGKRQRLDTGTQDPGRSGTRGRGRGGSRGRGGGRARARGHQIEFLHIDFCFRTFHVTVNAICNNLKSVNESLLQVWGRAGCLNYRVHQQSPWYWVVATHMTADVMGFKIHCQYMGSVSFFTSVRAPPLACVVVCASVWASQV